jgi:phosphoribosylformylglycinamidine synthase
VPDAAYFARAFEAVQGLISSGAVLAGHDVSAGGLVTTLLEMTFADNRSGMEVDLRGRNGGEGNGRGDAGYAERSGDGVSRGRIFGGEKDIVKLLFSEKPALVLQVRNGAEVVDLLAKQDVDAEVIGRVNFDRSFNIRAAGVEFDLLVDDLRDKWYKTSYLLDRKQSGTTKAAERYTNYAKQELNYNFPAHFTGKYAQYGIDPHRRNKTGLKAAVIREKGCQCERETAWMLHLAGFDVRDVHMTDLVSGRETLEDVNMIVFSGGFSNSDVLGSAKGWAGAFLYNENARQALERFYARPDTLSMGICNGCQLMVELGLIKPVKGAEEASDRQGTLSLRHGAAGGNTEVKHIGQVNNDISLMPKMLHNDSHKFESGFVAVDVQAGAARGTGADGGQAKGDGATESGGSVMLASLAGSRLGVWVAHGEGKFSLPGAEADNNILLKYGYEGYPANPNGSDYGAAAIASADGRHLAMMPHPERAIKPWNWAYYPEERGADEVSPWVEAFVNARKWVEAAVATAAATVTTK